MLADPLTLKDSAGVDVVFNLVSNITDPKTGKVTTTRTDASRISTPGEPRILIVEQTQTGSGLNRVRRTTVRVLDTHLSSAGVPYTTSYQSGWVFVLNGEFTTTDLDDSICIVDDLFLSTTGLAVDSTKRGALLQGQA